MKQVKGTGLDQQHDTELLNTLATTYQLSIAEGMKDLGKSAYKGEHLNHELGAFISAIKSGLVAAGSILVVQSLDRLSRLKLGYAKQIYLDVTNAGIHIYSMLDTHLYQAHNVGDEILSSIIFERAHNESDTKSKRTVGNAIHMINAHNEGKRSEDGYAFAIKSIASKHAWYIDTSDGTVKPHPYYWDAAQHLAKLIISGMSIGMAKEEMDKLYNPPKTSKWITSTLRRFHLTEALTGTRTLTIKGTEYKLKGYYPELLSEDDYLLLTAIRAKRATYSRPSSAVNLITGMNLAKCSCGGSVGYQSKTSSDIGNLCCLSAKKKEAVNCKGWNVTLRYIEPVVLKVCADVLVNLDTDRVDKEIVILKMKLKGKREVLDSYVDAASEGVLPKSLLTKMVALETEIEQIEADIHNKQIDSVHVSDELSDLWKKVVIVPPMSDKARRTELKALVKKSINRITFTKLDGLSYYELKFEFVNGVERLVKIRAGVVESWIESTDMMPHIEDTYLSTGTALGKELGIPMIINLPIEKD